MAFDGAVGERAGKIRTSRSGSSPGCTTEGGLPSSVRTSSIALTYRTSSRTGSPNAHSHGALRRSRRRSSEYALETCRGGAVPGNYLGCAIHAARSSRSSSVIPVAFPGGIARVSNACRRMSVARASICSRVSRRTPSGAEAPE